MDLIQHLDLFSGLGGFALAIEMVFGAENVEHIFCENDPFSQAILKKHWPNSSIYGDIKELTADRIVADTRSKRRQQKSGSSSSNEETHERWRTQNHNKSASDDKGTWRPDILTGGFPCQPFSAAGRRAGTEDDRHLWPEMLRVIRETHPTYVLGENVGGLLTWDGGMVFEQVCTDLESAGYEVGTFVIPAAAVDAPHRRDRVWIAAHRIGAEQIAISKQSAERWDPSQSPDTTRENINAEDTKRIGRSRRRDGDKRYSERAHKATGPDTTSGKDASYAGDEGLQGSKREQSPGYRGLLNRDGSDQRAIWTEDWTQVAARLCTLDDGLPDGLARPRGWRNAALKGAGNAIVPQVAAEIIRSMFLQ